MIISVVQLGTLDYATGLRLQQRLVELRKNNEIANVLLLLEHTPVITLGRNARRNNVLASDELLKQRGVELFECDRGGDVTYHGPGQLVGYPIFDLRSFLGPDGQRKTLGAVDYVRRLEEALVRTCADFGIPTERVAGMTGVWTQLSTAVITSGANEQNKPLRPVIPSGANERNNPLRPVIPSGANERSNSLSPVIPSGANERSERAQSRDPYPTHESQAKIAAIGVHISRGVTSHGFALNVNTDLENFNLIVPCGISTRPVTSLQRALGRAIALDDVAQSVARNFGRVFNSQIVWVDSLDALLGRSVDVPARAPQELRKMAGEEDTFWV
ncbi:MAG: lipoyl(octanoyl) transferase, partial [Terriglobales bacterium]